MEPLVRGPVDDDDDDFSRSSPLHASMGPTIRYWEYMNEYDRESDPIPVTRARGQLKT
jgi:hypothetical protein